MAKKLWGGRFSKKTDPLVEEFTKSIQYDYKLAKHDVLGSLVHAKILAKAGLISQKEGKIISQGLSTIWGEIKSNKFVFDKNAEDIHTDIQNKLEKKIGVAALKLHTARSRNDQVVFDTKRYCVFEGAHIIKLIKKFMGEIDNFAGKNKNIILPGYTHMQHAQPVALKNYILAYKYMLKRDSERLSSALKRMNYPLGSGALAGTPIEAEVYNKAAKEISDEMGHPFFGTVENSIDNVSDRDFVVEILSALSIIGMHFSRLAEDLIIWSTKEFGFVEIDDAFCTGSSLMPQKKNPDTLELIRGYTGKLYGNLVSVLVTMKGLPLTYNRDMQLDKEPLFDSTETIKKELMILAKLIKGIKINKDKIYQQLKDESLYATDLIYYLVDRKIPFKNAHNIIGKLVKYSVENDIQIKDMPESLLKKFSDKFIKKEIVKLFDPLVSVKSKRSIKR
ncbi:MAG: argininosuccinate lyase [Candidatus Omnitrophica bacterium]|nr:argininosuccinate lyase [Candidatus Omnitrophota bacterium]MDD5027579.1 argininosuccinate lyase [Candidatus Omnitrophota bacterium]MDD5662379.1 argininosuccinate lyase [Candidatus Omnitrophota bacterium]